MSRKPTPRWLLAIIWLGIAVVPAFAFVQCSNDPDYPAYEIAPDEF